MGFTLSFELTPINDTTCELVVDVAADPKGALRLMEPVVRRVFPRRSRRITDAMIAVIETTANPDRQSAPTR